MVTLFRGIEYLVHGCLEIDVLLFILSGNQLFFEATEERCGRPLIEQDAASLPSSGIKTWMGLLEI